MFERAKQSLGRALAHYLTREVGSYRPFSIHRSTVLSRVLVPGDILLVEGNARISTAIKYLTQSTWSHAAFYAGPIGDPVADETGQPCLIEAEIRRGVIAVPISKYRNFNTRICRPVGLSLEDRDTVVRFMVERIGLEYDLKNVIDLARYLFPLPLPAFLRRRMIALGSGDPTRAICSTLLAQAFQLVQYPILPRIETDEQITSDYTRREILHIRHHSLFAPRDFDLSPYFRIVKPTIEAGFDYKRLRWADPGNGQQTAGNR